jgi:hypothetical protein
MSTTWWVCGVSDRSLDDFVTQVAQCTDKAIALQQSNNSRALSRVAGSLTSLSQESSSKHTSPPQTLEPAVRLESELMSLVYSLQGQALLVALGPGAPAGAVRPVLEAFLESAR